ncbi:prolyl oligopeptidase family serine peptidase [Salipaludibacillus sp. CUR1]|uniref:alpha/beta hydrolase family protein n=1 Tax=Salipaludibacillus sp. CUR1 TaxID=2820003 RepID=UPI001E4D7FF4|nr:prolyl oligopeptidase family serine peptidase [Salipaludibacillus sp. CUR1]MCE7792916.1 prolyl oligopeptidase family serine peptidase [Salipaludibacillus sp. CUR1]
MLKRGSVAGLVLLLGACSGEEDALVEKNELSHFTSDFDVSAWEIVYKSDDYLIDGYVVRPNGPEDEYPTLIINRGGNRDFGEITEQQLAGLHAYWADKGYTVIASQYREGGDSEGEDEFGGEDVTDVMQLEQVAKELTFADEETIFMLGYSRGGIMAYRAIAEGMDVTAAAAVGGVSDMMDTYEFRGPRMKRVLVDLVGHPAEVPEAYAKRSALEWPEDITVPLMLLHGEADEQVPLDQSVRLYEALHELGFETELVTYEEGDHGLSDYFDEYTMEIDEWFYKYK